MKSIFWLKLKNKKFIKTLLLVMVISIIAFIIYIKLGVSINSIIGFFPIVPVLLIHLFSFNYDIFSMSENILSTTISIKKIWQANSIFSTVLGYLMGEIIIIGGIIYIGYQSGINGANILSIGMNIINLFTCIVLILLCTMYYANYSKSLQYISSIFSLSHFCIPFFFPKLVEQIEINIPNIVIIVGLQVICFSITSLIMKTSSKEKFIINSAKELQLVGTGVEVE